MTHDPDVVEKIARALNAKDVTMTNFDGWDVIDDDVKDEYRELARAALDAIDALYADEVTL